MYQKKHSGWLWFVCLNGSRFLLTPNSFRMHGLVIPSLWRGVALFKDLTSVQRRAVAPIRYSPRMSSAERRLQRVCICTCSCVCVLQDVQKHVLENSNAICTSPNYITLYVYIYNYVYTVLVLLARFSPRWPIHVCEASFKNAWDAFAHYCIYTCIFCANMWIDVCILNICVYVTLCMYIDMTYRVYIRYIHVYV